MMVCWTCWRVVCECMDLSWCVCVGIVVMMMMNVVEDVKRNQYARNRLNYILNEGQATTDTPQSP